VAPAALAARRGDRAGAVAMLEAVLAGAPDNGTAAQVLQSCLVGGEADATRAIARLEAVLREHPEYAGTARLRDRYVAAQAAEEAAERLRLPSEAGP
jgi:hypothetical protein